MNLQEKSQIELSKWLDQTQRESWQLELIFSGFVIFLLLNGLEPYHALWPEVERLADTSNYFVFLMFPYQFFRAAYYVLLVSTIIHVFLRGLWISTVGLRSVSGQIEWDKMNFQPKFNDFLKTEIKSFDHYIDKIERYCSISFAFAFLVVFSIAAACFFLLGLVALQIGIRALMGSQIFRGDNFTGPDDVIMLLYAVLGLVYLIDFLSLGMIKKIKWLSPVYYPIYRFYGFITMAKFYRPIYYNLIDIKLGRRLSLFILPLGLVIMVLMSIRYYSNAYIPHTPERHSTEWYLAESYDDIDAEKIVDNRPSINSQVISDNHLKVFVPYLAKDHDPTIAHLCPDLEPGYFTGLKLRGAFSTGEIKNWDSSSEDILACMRQLWRVSIDDSLYTDVKFRFYNHPKREQPGMMSIIPIHHLDNTEHFIKIDRHRVNSDTMRWYEGRNLWFYKK